MPSKRRKKAEKMLTERRLSLRTTEDLIARLHKVIERSGEKQNVFLERAIKREVERREKGEGNGQS